MNGEALGLDAGTILAVYMALLLFGIGFNILTAWAERRGYTRGYLAMFVVAGVAVTVGLMAIVHLVFALLMAGAFICSGTPMIIGSMWRHMREDEQELERLRQEAHSGDAK